MTGWRVGVAAWLAVLATAGPCAGQEVAARRGGKYALLVGVRKYPPDTLRDLPFTESDIKGLAGVLERSGYRREDITILTQGVGAEDPAYLPLGKNLRAQLGLPAGPGKGFTRGLKLGPLDEEDTLVVALVGHGVQFDPDGESYFCPMDADLSDATTLIKLSEVSRALDGSRAGLKLLLVDACRNNPQIHPGRDGERPVVESPSLSRPFPRVKAGGTMALFSCSPGERAFEDPAVGHGIFTHQIMLALNGEAGFDGRLADADGDGRVDAFELSRFAERNVFAQASRLYRREQTVEVVNRIRGGVAIVEGRPRKLEVAVRRPDRMTIREPVREDEEVTNTIGMKLKLIPAGEFQMGAPDGEKDALAAERPRHRVRITRPFYLGVYEVTQGEYEAVMGTNPSDFSAKGQGNTKVSGQDTSRYPVENVSWNDAIAFCNKLSERDGLKPYYQFGAGARSGGEGYRLPTEAEWEYACRAGTTTATAFGDKLSSREANFNGNNPYNGAAKGSYLERPASVGSYGANAFGLYDMHGNVNEWCSDFYDENFYKSSKMDDPAGLSAAWDRVFRGGGWFYDGWLCRSADRYGFAPDVRYDSLGFRVARVRSSG